MKKYSSIYNHLRLKLLYKNIFNSVLPLTTMHINLYKLKSFDDDKILENLFLLESLSSMKSSIKTYKKGYQNNFIQIISSLRNHYSFFFLRLLRFFYFPLLKRRGNLPEMYFDKGNNIMFSIKFINEIPFISEIYFKNENPILVSLFLKSNSKKKSQILISYYSGFEDIKKVL